ncbi:MAG: TonB-dependent receptor [Gemmatimonadaceae bacterium]
MARRTVQHSARLVWRALLFVAVPAIIHAQTSVAGTVVDKPSGRPVTGATVTVVGTEIRTTTTQDGAFTLRADRAIARISVSRAGYADEQVAVSNGSQGLRVELTPLQTLPGVQVVADRPTPGVEVLTKSDLDRFNGLNLVDAINTVPGVFMQTRTPFGGARITMRGYYPSTSGNSPNSNGLGYQVFLNGIPITDATGTTVLDDVDYSTLGSAQIIKGPASSLFGSYIGGTVNLVTARPSLPGTSVSQQVTAGTYSLLRTNTSLEHQGDASDFVLNYGHQGYDSFREHSASSKEYLRGSGDFSVGTNQNLSTYFSYNRSFEELAGEIDSTDFYARRPVSDANYLANDSHIQITSFFSGVTDNYRIDDHFSNQTTVFGSARTSGQPFAHGFTDVNQFNLGARSAFVYSAQLSDIGVNGTLGGMAQRSNLTSNGVFIIPAPPYVERPTAQENYAIDMHAFTEWNFTFPSAVTLTVGGSVNKNQFAIRNLLKSNQLFDTTALAKKSFDAVFTPRAAISKTFDNNISAYVSVSTGYTPPLLSNIISNTGAVDTTLKPERGVQYEVGTRGTALNGRLTGNLALFDLENTDKLVTQTVSSVTSTVNAGKQRNKGGELSLSYLAVSSSNKSDVLTLLRPWVTYTYTDAKYVDFKSDNNSNASTVSFSGNAVARVPKTMASAGIDASTGMGLYANGTYQYVDKVPVTFDNSTWVKSYSLLSAKIGYKQTINRDYLLNIYAGGDNLGNSTYYNALFTGPNIKGLAQGPDGGTGDGYILPAPYKSTYYFNISLSYAF